MGIVINRHEVSKDKNKRATKMIIGVEYSNPINGKVTYVERLFTIGIAGDFLSVPTVLGVQTKIKEWLESAPPQKDGTQGKSVLQTMKDQTDMYIGTSPVIDIDSLVGTTIEEDVLL